MLAQVHQQEAKRQFRSIQKDLPSCGRILIIGSGYGFLGTEILLHTSMELQEADTIDRNVQNRSPQLYHSETLPYPSSLFDAVILNAPVSKYSSLVLILAEALRVSKFPVLLLHPLAPASFLLNKQKRSDALLISIRKAVWDAGGRILHTRQKGIWKKKVVFMVEARSRKFH